MNKLIIIRGQCGSGKSTLARKIKSESYNPSSYIHLEADMYHIDVHGNYNWKPENLKASHIWCFDSTRIFLTQGRNVIVSNTFTTKKEYQPYIDLAKEMNVEVEIIVCKGEYKNVHNVPEETLKKMKERWEE